MGLVVGLLLGAGLFCCWWACWPSPARSPRRRSRWRVELEDALVQAEVPGLTLRTLLVLSAASALVVGLLVLALAGSPAIAGCFAVMAAWAPTALVRGRARRRRTQVRDLWPEAVDHLASGVRAGLSLPEALGSLSERGPEQLRPAFRSFAEDYRATGRFAASLEALKERLADPIGDRVVEALRITREVGGSDLGRLLRTLSTFLREDARLRSELEARQSWTVNAARLAVSAPWIVLALLATRREAVQAYDEPAGALVLAVGGAVSVVAYRVMVRIGRLPEDERVLR
ncbi:type II secretion system F family protein [Quadrisphaera sp. DSM 44207]|uniref:type II secretion system F family protein n=1 Tax=Quadrisphaera sp. DSM 44207 TaxID=1881057 RepID=UPI000881F1EF|nr:type II secretion system F family protein [Quadrisphaera sp. DSM 44207]SDQ08506.1 tight adherence protein B [Quadrisphaera sp. DSM 44207]